MNFSDMVSGLQQATQTAQAVASSVGITPPPGPAPSATAPRTWADDAMSSVGGGAGLSLGGLILGYVVLRYFRIVPKII